MGKKELENFQFDMSSIVERISFLCVHFILQRYEHVFNPNWDSFFKFPFFAACGLYRKADFKFIPNRRGGLSLVYNGFSYTVERKYKTTTNWVCSKNSSVLKCPARCVTSDDTIKLSRRVHNHDPIFT